MPNNSLFDQTPTVLRFKENVNFDTQCQQIQDDAGFGSYEGGEFNAHDFAFFVLLQEKLKRDKEKAQKFHEPPRHVKVEYRGQQYPVEERSFLWTGEKLFILSRQHARQGTMSFFRRVVTVPESTEDPLQFYAMITSVSPRSINFLNHIPYLKKLKSDYQSSCKAYLCLYPYVKPQLITYQSDWPLEYEYITKESGMLPALLTRSIGSWETIHTTLVDDKELSVKGFLAIMGWFLCVLMLQKSSLVHCDMSAVNVTVFGPSVLCQLIDLSNLVRLDQGCAHVSNTPLSAYPDHCASSREFDLNSDVFSVAMNLLMVYALRQEPSDFPALSELHKMNKDTNDYFYSNHEERKNKYSILYDKLKSLHVNKFYNGLVPHLFNFVHPDRDKRASVLNMFSDQGAMKIIHKSVNLVIDHEHYAPLFTDVGDLSLRDSIKQLMDNANQQDIAVTSILLLLMYALHCHTLDEEVRIDHKKKIEMVLEGMPLSPSCQTLLDRYETPFPGQRTNNLIDQVVDDSESKIIELLLNDTYNEHVYTQCKSTLLNLSERVEEKVHLDQMVDDAMGIVLKQQR